MHTTIYRGRFAPSPTGPLHMGSLVCALASFLDAKQHHGLWFVRMEDIDPPREEPGAGEAILEALRAHQLQWDNDVVFQSRRSQAYTDALKRLDQAHLSYSCNCNRKRLAQLNGIYDGHCKTHPPPQNSICAIRIKTHKAAEIHFEDRVRGRQTENLADICGDFVIHRKDGLFAYQLAVVVDDIDQGINHIVRGDDLLDCTSRQIYLTQVLGGQTATYAHIPVIKGVDGDKLSKQTFAPALNIHTPKENLVTALNLLRVPTALSAKHWPIHELLQHGCERFNLTNLN